EDGGAGFLANFKSEFVRDPETKKRIFAEAIFGDPSKTDKIRELDDGRWVADLGGEYKIVDEGFLSSLGQFAGQAPEIVGGVAGTFATANPYVGAVAGEVTGRAVKQIIGNLVFDEPQTSAGNAADLALSGALAAVPEGLAAGGV